MFRNLSRRVLRGSTSLPLTVPFPWTTQKRRFLETSTRTTTTTTAKIGTTVVRRICGGCKNMLSVDAFSDKCRCVGSTHNKHLPMCDVCRDSEQIVTSQQHLFDRQTSPFNAIFNAEDIQNPKMQGGYTYVALGSYCTNSKGPDKVDRCIIKWWKSGPVQSHDLYDIYMRRILKAYDLIMMFNHEKIILEPVYLQIPSIVQLDSGNIVLQEPYIEQYQKWNSNSGWYSKSNDSWSLAFQALSHFSYHISDGLYVLCNVTGGLIGERETEAILTDVVVHSRSREFDAADLGTSGIYNFFANHQCNEFCNPGWFTPIKHKKIFPTQPQTMLYDNISNE
jgi:hypothetical protein